MFITKKEYKKLVLQRDELMELAERTLNSNKKILEVAEDVQKHNEKLIEQNEQLVRAMKNYIVPCDLCKFNPPSSFGNKPCSVCPAQGKGDAE